MDTRNFWSHLAQLDDAAAPSTTPARWDVLIASHSLSELPLETFRMYLAALSGRYTYVLYCTQVEWPTVEESSLKRSLLEARYSNHRQQLIATVDWWLSALVH